MHSIECETRVRVSCTKLIVFALSIGSILRLLSIDRIPIDLNDSICALIACSVGNRSALEAPGPIRDSKVGRRTMLPIIWPAMSLAR